MTVDWGLPVSVGGVFFFGVLIGYAIKKVITIAAVIVGFPDREPVTNRIAYLYRIAS
jgi:hypothetical protein